MISDNESCQNVFGTKREISWSQPTITPWSPDTSGGWWLFWDRQADEADEADGAGGYATIAKALVRHQ